MQNIFPHNAAMELCERLKRARQRRFETAKAAADFLGIPYGTLTGHESGSRGVKDNELRRYAKTYGVELPWLKYEIGPEVRGQNGAAPLSHDERLIIDAYRKLPPEEAVAHRDLLLARTSASPPVPEADTAAAKRGRR
jgi:hypothetical protein